MQRAQGHIDTMLYTGATAPIGCPKTDAHEGVKFTNAAHASGNIWRTPELPNFP